MKIYVPDMGAYRCRLSIILRMAIEKIVFARLRKYITKRYNLVFEKGHGPIEKSPHSNTEKKNVLNMKILLPHMIMEIYSQRSDFCCGTYDKFLSTKQVLFVSLVDYPFLRIVCY